MLLLGEGVQGTRAVIDQPEHFVLATTCCQSGSGSPREAPGEILESSIEDLRRRRSSLMKSLALLMQRGERSRLARPLKTKLPSACSRS